MSLRSNILTLISVSLVFTLCTVSSRAGSSYDRELVVKDQARAQKATSVLDNLITAYENEDAREFFDYVSEERFRQDYLTFTDALYQDFRTYEIHHVEYWVQRVVSDNVKQFVYVNWEKRYETLDDSRQLFRKGISCFVFDEVNGDYLLIQLQGNDLFGASLPEWTEETPSIPGQEPGQEPVVGDSGQDIPSVSGPDLKVGSTVLSGSSLLDVSVQNTGTGSSGPTRILMEEGFMIAAPFTSYVDLPGLAPGEIYTFDHFFGGPPPYRITLDPDNTVSETNEANNTKIHSD